jgi:GH25 family lysozyme M1 (1,4-beta-N-acetylmuramidase)
MSEYRGIDVSHWQGAIDWTKVKAAGIQFAIIKSGGSDAGFLYRSQMGGELQRSQG